MNSKKKTIGPLDNVPCPYCGRHNNMRPLYDFDQVLEPGTKVDCDHCKNISTVVRIDKRPRVILKA